MAGQQYLVEKPFVYNHSNKVVEQRETGVVVKLEDEEARQAGDAVTPLGHDGPAKKSSTEGLSERTTRENLDAQAKELGLDPQQFPTKKALLDALGTSGSEGDSGKP